MRGPNPRTENTSLHRENFVRVDKLHSPAAQHDSHGAILFAREVDGPLDGRVHDPLPADPVVHADLCEDLRVLLRPLRVRLDFERREIDPLLLKNQDDICCPACKCAEKADSHASPTTKGRGASGTKTVNACT